MFGRGKTARLRQGANGTAHDFVGDAYKALGDFVDAHGAAGLGVDTGRQSLECLERCMDIKTLVFIRAKNTGKHLDRQTTGHKVCVCDGQGASFAVASRTWVSRGAVRTHDKEAVAEEQARRATRCYRIDVKLRALDGDAIQRGFHDVLVATRIPRYVCRGAAHVETNTGPTIPLIVCC